MKINGITFKPIGYGLGYCLGKKFLKSHVYYFKGYPDLPYEKLAGIRVCRLGFRHKSEPVVKSTDPHGRTIYWVGPAGDSQESGEGTDFHALEHGAAAITPLKIDLTRHEALSQVEDWLQRD